MKMLIVMLLAVAETLTATNVADTAVEASNSAIQYIGRATYVEPCAVERIIDGDTFVCDDGERVRLLLIDTPEADQDPYGAIATVELRRLLPVGTVVRLELDVQHRDRYGRLLAYVHLQDGGTANAAMLRAGLAVVAVYPPNVRHVDQYRAIADSARAARRGLWATPVFRCLPAEHRRGSCE